MELPASFPHEPPTKDHFYEVVCFKRFLVAIWIVYRPGFVYNDHHPVHCIWGFYNTKTKTYHSPINSSKCGDSVDIQRTTPYSAMQLKLTPLEMAYV